MLHIKERRAEGAMLGSTKRAVQCLEVARQPCLTGHSVDAAQRNYPSRSTAAATRGEHVQSW